MFGKASKIHFDEELVTRWLLPVEIPFYRDIDRQRGRGFGAFAQAIGRAAFLFLRKCVVPAAKRVGVVLMDFAPP